MKVENSPGTYLYILCLHFPYFSSIFRFGKCFSLSLSITSYLLPETFHRVLHTKTSLTDLSSQPCKCRAGNGWDYSTPRSRGEPPLVWFLLSSLHSQFKSLSPGSKIYHHFLGQAPAHRHLSSSWKYWL